MLKNSAAAESPSEVHFARLLILAVPLRALRLGRYISEAVSKSVELWAKRVGSEEWSADSEVLLPQIQEFLGAREIDKRRLDSLRSSRSSNYVGSPKAFERFLKGDSMRQPSPRSSVSSDESDESMSE